MTKSTEKEYKLNIDPRILELLGPNLYTNIYYVLAELIANAYDANASNVYIITDKNSITVEDDGVGMSYSSGDVDRFLDVAKETRTSTDNSFVPESDKKRVKMGRKGVGKLAALSVSENVIVKTIKNGEKSGFILSRKVRDDKTLDPIDDSYITFSYISDNGTAIVMKDPQYDLNKTLKSAKNNILRIFPLVDKNFRIHLKMENKSIVIIDSFEKDIISGLACMITLGDDFHSLHENFEFDPKNLSNTQKESLSKRYESHICRLNNLKKKDGTVSDYNLKISGWIGAYRSTKGRKKNQVDFPDNFISLVSNKKVGEFNILPVVGKNALNEVYVVGQLHIDLFEHSDLPDMALSNRQGYKSDDKRYEAATKYIRNELLPEIISMRSKYTSYKKATDESIKNKRKLVLEESLRKGIDDFKQNAVRKSVDEISRLDGNATSKDIATAIEKSINTSLPDMGIKSKVDGNKKRLLISHSSKNKAIGDFSYNLLTFTGIPGNDIIYTSNDDAISRVPESEGVFDYLKKFFVNSYSTEKIYVLYITSDEMASSWACVSEVGAGWILKSEHNLFNLNSHTPREPLNTSREWANIEYNNENESIEITHRTADVLADKIIHICNFLGYSPKNKSEILSEISKKVNYTDG
ncbi:MAG: ATP-binding protein [Tenuifilaceae bacterium]|nr:ATP-binding protein [Tenuifilaceae bacterium]